MRIGHIANIRSAAVQLASRIPLPPAFICVGEPSSEGSGL
nr:MAG TPA: hypothetical protein [Caudoviricetes sp.]